MAKVVSAGVEQVERHQPLRQDEVDPRHRLERVAAFGQVVLWREQHEARG